MTTRREYVLGTGADELERLGIQHRLWSDAAHEAWKMAGIAPGQRVLDIGCGPGYACFDLAMMVGHTGEVVGIDESAGFVGYLGEQAERRGLPWLRGVTGDVQAMGTLPEVAAGGGKGFDLAYARWVLCFVKDPSAVIEGATRLVRPGGAMVIHDYFNYESMTMAPRSAAWAEAVSATAKSWRERGGDPDVMGRVPGMLVERGWRIESLRVHQRIARGHEAMFTWPDTWWRTYTPKLVQMGLVSQATCDRLMADLDAVRRDPGRFVVCPPVFEVIARRGGG
jgi:ubiquinone/menaquinone biosynthesis C-methylase UbiE